MKSVYIYFSNCYYWTWFNLRNCILNLFTHIVVRIRIGWSFFWLSRQNFCWIDLIYWFHLKLCQIAKKHIRKKHMKNDFDLNEDLKDRLKAEKFRGKFYCTSTDSEQFNECTVWYIPHSILHLKYESTFHSSWRQNPLPSEPCW